MTTIGFNMTDNDPTYGWADIKPIIHPYNRLLALSVCAWKIASKMVDDGYSMEDIERMMQTARELEELSDSECKCNPRNDNCKVCSTVNSLIYDEKYIEWSRDNG